MVTNYMYILGMSLICWYGVYIYNMVYMDVYIHIHATHFGVRGGFVVREMEFFIGARPSGIFTSPGAPGQWGEYLRRPNHEVLSNFQGSESSCRHP